PPHPDAVPSSRSSFSGHYYAGVMFDGTNTTASQIRATLNVPRDTPTASDFYYVLVSAWDDAGSYDQIGFSSGGGVFGVSYSTTTPCATNYLFSSDAYNLTGGLEYTFQMIVSGGTVDFTVSTPSQGTVWSYSAVTG